MIKKESLIDKSLYRVIENDVFSMYKPAIIKEYVDGLKYEVLYNDKLSDIEKEEVKTIIINGERYL